MEFEGANMRKWSFVVVVVMFLGILFSALTILPNIAKASTLYVGGAGPGNYTTIQEAIDGANPGDTVRVYSGTYYGSIYVDKTISLSGEGRDTTVIDAGGSTWAVKLSADWVNITGFTVRSNGSRGIVVDHDFGHSRIHDNNVSHNGDGIVLHSSEHNAITNNSVFSNGGSGIFLDYSGNNTIANNTVSLNDEYGILIWHSNFNTVSGNDFLWNNLSGIALESSKNNALVNNAMLGDGIWVAFAGGLEHWNTHTIGTSNTVNGKPVYYWKNVVGGTVPSGAGQVILVNCTNVSVQDQSFDDAAIGIELGFSSGIFIVNNGGSSGRGGIILGASHNNIIAHNTAGTIILGDSWNNTVVDNEVSGSEYIGIGLTSSDNTTIAGNRVFNNTVGLWASNCDGGSITGNELFSNDGGIHIRYSRANTITQNTVSNNGLGISIQSSDDNTVYHNNFINNTDQAWDAGFNSWDNGYPSGGNYWSNYTGIDEKSGPNQDQPGSDGIGDTMYDIMVPGYGDRYPLMSPFEPTAGPPSAPWNLHAVPGNQQATLTWFPPLDDGGLPITNYTIYRGTTSGGETLLVTTGDVNSYVDTGLTNGVIYYYLLAAVNGVGEGANSIEVNATPFNQAPVCSIGTPDSEATISDTYTISGNASDDDGTVEGVEIRIDDGPWVKVNGTMSWSYEWDTTHESNGEHTIYVRSHDGRNYSTEVSVHVEVYNLPHGDPVAGQVFWWVMIGLVIVIAGAGLISEVRRRKKQT